MAWAPEAQAALMVQQAPWVPSSTDRLMLGEEFMHSTTAEEPRPRVPPSATVLWPVS